METLYRSRSKEKEQSFRNLRKQQLTIATTDFSYTMVVYYSYIGNHTWQIRQNNVFTPFENWFDTIY